MGSEFERKRAAAFKKRLDKSLLALGTPDLFTQTPTRGSRIVAAEIIGGACLQKGDDLVLQKKGTGVVAMKELTEVAALPSPPLEILNLLETSFGFAKGVVEVVHDEAFVLEISVC